MTFTVFPITYAYKLGCSPEHAFAVFTGSASPVMLDRFAVLINPGE